MIRRQAASKRETRRSLWVRPIQFLFLISVCVTKWKRLPEVQRTIYNQIQFHQYIPIESIFSWFFLSLCCIGTWGSANGYRNILKWNQHTISSWILSRRSLIISFVSRIFFVRCLNFSYVAVQHSSFIRVEMHKPCRVLCTASYMDIFNPSNTIRL